MLCRFFWHILIWSSLIWPLPLTPFPCSCSPSNIFLSPWGEQSVVRSYHNHWRGVGGHQWERVIIVMCECASSLISRLMNYRTRSWQNDQPNKNRIIWWEQHDQNNRRRRRFLKGVSQPPATTSTMPPSHFRSSSEWRVWNRMIIKSLLQIAVP